MNLHGKLLRRLMGEGSQANPIWWLRTIMPFAVLVIILFLVKYIYFDETFWMARELAPYPVSSRARGHKDGPRPIKLNVSQEGRLSLGNGEDALTSNEIARILSFVKITNGRISYILICAESKAKWSMVKPWISVLRDMGYEGELLFRTRSEDDEAIPSSIEVFIQQPPTNRVVTLVRNSHGYIVNGKQVDLKRLNELIGKLAEVDKETPCVLSFDPSASMQDVISSIDVFTRRRIQNVFLVSE